MLEKLYMKKGVLKKEPEFIKIIVFYRYLSLIITSLVYFAGDFNHALEKKIFIITCIAVSSIAINTLYVKNLWIKPVIGLLIFIEIVGNSLLLIPSGGLNSPYVWYSINTILVSAIAFNKVFCWINTTIYLINATYISFLVNPRGGGFIQSLRAQSNLILSFILITGIIQILARYGKSLQSKSQKLMDTNKQLEEVNRKNKDFIKHIMELYETVQLFSSGESKHSIIALIIEFAQKLTKAEGVMVIHSLNGRDKLDIDSVGISAETKEGILEKYSEIMNVLQIKPSVELAIKNMKLLLCPIKSNYRDYGIIGLNIDFTSEEENNYFSILEQAKFLSSLSAITLEKIHLEQINEKILINEEQNRIADEIHDGILQRLFSVSCCLYEVLNKEHLQERRVDIDNIRNTIDSVTKDIRSTIYSLSWRKNEEHNFISDIRNFIKEVKALNNIDVNLKLIGTEEYLSTGIKKAIYRIICEGIGNAVRHGGAKSITVELDIGLYNTVLKITDNGVGFDTAITNNSNELGLGLKNMSFLARSLNGEIKIESIPGKGTAISAIIPCQINIRKEEAV